MASKPSRQVQEERAPGFHKRGRSGAPRWADYRPPIRLLPPPGRDALAPAAARDTRVCARAAAAAGRQAVVPAACCSGSAGPWHKVQIVRCRGAAGAHSAVGFGSGGPGALGARHWTLAAGRRGQARTAVPQGAYALLGRPVNEADVQALAPAARLGNQWRLGPQSNRLLARPLGTGPRSITRLFEPRCRPGRGRRSGAS
jgi:hypothetical protein